jgi:hypothetical protein
LLLDAKPWNFFLSAFVHHPLNREARAMTNHRSVEELKRDSEHTRAVLVETVDQLRTKASTTASDIRVRLSPDTMKAEVGDYFRSQRERLIDKARENPLQAAAIGVGLAYPLLGIVRAIPTPVLMIGAGLFLMGSKTGQSITRDVADRASDAAERLSDGAEAFRKGAQDAQGFAAAQVASAGQALSSGADALSQKAAESADALRQRAVGAAEAVKGRAAALAAQSGETMDAASAAARQGASDALFNVRDTLQSAARYGADAGAAARERTSEAAGRAATVAADTMQRHPLLVGGVGLAIGAFIAACLPRSDVERSLMGGASEAVQNRAKDLAQKGLDAAKEVASAAYAGGVERAEREGLTSDALNEATEELGEKMHKVADRASDAAFGTAADERIR